MGMQDRSCSMRDIFAQGAEVARDLMTSPTEALLMEMLQSAQELDSLTPTEHGDLRAKALAIAERTDDSGNRPAPTT